MNEFSPKAEKNDMEQPRTVERFAMLVISSCSEHRFICRRQRGTPSLDTLRAQYSDIGHRAVKRRSDHVGVIL